MHLQPGQTVSHFEILGVLGAGAMGEVYRARDTHLGREVAIKVLPAHLADDEERLRRFEREAKALASLNHPSVAQIWGVEREGDLYLLELEMVPGETLQDRLARGAMPLDEALEICTEIAEGLEAAHDAGVIHRDLKPANVRITPEGRVKLLDFGLAKPARAGEPKSSSDSVLSTEQGRLLGTPTYMAPEQARGRAIDKRVDLWAFGCVLFECLTGARAFAGETLSDVLASVLQREPDWSRLPAGTPARVGELLARCLTKDSARRQRGAGDAALELRAAHAHPAAPAAGRRAHSALVPWAVAGLAGAAAAWSAWHARAGSGAAPTEARVLRFECSLPEGTRLCPNDRVMNELAIAPDGSSIAYLVEQDGGTALYLHALDRLDAQRLELGQDVRGPCFSPDGQWLAYAEGFETLMRAPIAGGPPQRIGTVAPPSGSLAWLADGQLAFADVTAARLWEVDVASGAAQLVAETRASFEGFENVAATPDPSWFLADGWKGLGTADLRVLAVDRASGSIEVLVQNASNPQAVGDDILVFQRGAALFAQRFDFRAKRPLGEPRMIVSGVTTDRWGSSSQYAVSRGGALVFAPGKRRGEGRRMVWKGPDGVVEPIRSEPDAFAHGIDLACEGNALLVSTVRDHEQYWTFDLIGRSLDAVAEGEINQAVISPDGDEVVYSINTETGPELRRLPAGGGAPSLIARERLLPGSVSPDGRYVLAMLQHAAGPDTQTDIVVIDTSSSPVAVEPWIATPFDEGEPRLSPDGRWVAYESNRSGRSEIFLRAWPAGSRDWKVSTGSGGQHGVPRWAPDGRALCYLDDVRLMRVELAFSDASGEPTVSAGAASEVFIDVAFAEAQAYGVGRDGRIAMIQLADWEREESRLEVVVGWRAEVERALEAAR